MKVQFLFSSELCGARMVSGEGGGSPGVEFYFYFAVREIQETISYLLVSLDWPGPSLRRTEVWSVWLELCSCGGAGGGSDLSGHFSCCDSC